MDYEVGTRVGAIAFADGNRVYFLGRGTYVGDRFPPANVNPALNMGFPNPKIELDNGDVVWGCECWWGPEDMIDENLNRFEHIIHISVEDFRAGKRPPVPGIEDIDGVELISMDEIPNDAKQRFMEFIDEDGNFEDDDAVREKGLDFIDVQLREGETMNETMTRAIDEIKKKYPGCKIVVPKELVKQKEEDKIDPEVN